MQHSVCMAGLARHTKAASNCYSDGRLHKEEANGEKCSGCIHSWTNDSYLKSLRDDLSHCETIFNDVSLDSNSRTEARAAAKRIERVLASELELATDNRQKLQSFTIAWQMAATNAQGQS